MPSSKRKQNIDGQDELYSNKSRARPTAEARVDPTYGQRSAIPGLDDETRFSDDDENLKYGDEMDALSYLRAVRQEATGIPNLLVAPKEFKDRDIYENGVGDYRGQYGDGAYYAAPEIETPVEEDSMDDENLARFDSILARFKELRTRLQQAPTAEAVERLGDDHPTYIGTLNTANVRWWRWKMKTIDPVPAQIANMDKRTVLKLLGLLTGGNLLHRGTLVQVGVSHWAWALLAKLPERGELNSEEIGVVRELGKKAVLVSMGLKDDTQLDEGLHEVEAGLKEEEGDEDDEILEVSNEEEIDLDIEEDAEEYDIEIREEIEQRNFGGYNLVQLSTPAASDSSQPILIGPVLPGSPQDTNLEISSVAAANEIPTLEASRMEEELEAAKNRMLGELSTRTGANATNTTKAAKLSGADGASVSSTPTEPDDSGKWNTRATVDMILTVAGEMYGQRDLLEFRTAWSELI